MTNVIRFFVSVFPLLACAAWDDAQPDVSEAIRVVVAPQANATRAITASASLATIDTPLFAPGDQVKVRFDPNNFRATERFAHTGEGNRDIYLEGRVQGDPYTNGVVTRVIENAVFIKSIAERHSTSTHAQKEEGIIYEIDLGQGVRKVYSAKEIVLISGHNS